MKSLAFAVLCVVALSSTAQAKVGATVRNDFGNSCSQNLSQDTGRSVEFGGNLNTRTDDAEISFKYVIELGRKNANTIDCVDMYNNSIRMENLMLRKMELELMILERKLNDAEKNTKTNTGDDW
tara:strand:+ start:307 stop:678 length:372 start_codon:yes stop_codon:yes gene_type:complete